MTRRLDVGVASYQNPDKLSRTLTKLQNNSRSDYRVLVVDNASPDPEVRRVIEKFARGNSRIIPRFRDSNIGYAGAVNEILEWAETEYIAYCDNDAEVETVGWDLQMAEVLDIYHELGIIFPNNGHMQIPRSGYNECFWAAGFFWMMPRLVYKEVGGVVTTLGHHEEVDLQTRIRLAGRKIACLPQIRVVHHASSTNNPAAQERIGRGIVAWVNKWVAYFGGKDKNYYSANVIRHDDWPVNALYLEEYFKRHLPGLNDNPEEVTINGTAYDLIKVPRLKGFYRGRII